jgi:V8-like Glu-specific endopeptidase
VRAEQIPGGTVLRFYGAPGSPVVELDAAALATLRTLNEQAGLDADAARMAWGPDTDGPVGTLEVQLPPGVAPEDLRLAVPQLSHLVQTVAQAVAQKDQRDIGAAGSCNLDVMCTAYQDEGRAVAKILFTRGGTTFLCSGTLLNDTRDSRTPYLLTASHCISQQADASSLASYWFFRAAACGASPGVDDAMVRVDGGAQLLVTNQAADSTLLQLNQPPPPNVLYAGSYFGASVGVGAEVLGIHHPQGDLQKASVGEIQGYARCPATDGPCQRTDASRGAMFRVGWRQGTTEGGSSGSALFAELDGTHYVVGALHGGNASCANPRGSDFYGRFQRAFAAGLGDWLAP